ncbi:MAG: protein kinase [Acidobacteriota bacterium]
MMGQLLSHYKILEKLGSGGMGEVYVAEDTKLSRKVALKVLPPEMASPERRKRFEREAKAVAALNHPNIVTVFSVEEARSRHFITMELVRGKNLSELLPKNGFPLSRFFEIAIALADAVAAAHQHGITHRDLKPDNIMVSDEGRLKVLDFGLAKLRPELVGSWASALPTQPATQEGRILGTVAYMSPEQAEGKTVDHRSDIFPLGILFYEMLTGQQPFRGDTATSILSAIIKDTPDSVTELNPSIPRDLAKLIKRCLAKDPTRRYQTALDVRNELEEIKQDVDSGEAVLGAVRPQMKRTPSRRLSWAGAVVVLAAVAWMMWPQGESSQQAVRRLTNPVQVTSVIGVEDYPAWSPVGRTLAYTAPQEG